MENSPLANRIEAYFAALEAPLTELPAARREEFLREARAHVQSMVEARRADGMDEVAAWEEALRDFGDPQEVGRALWREWASSGQLESEGAPLSKRDLVGWYLMRLMWTIPFLLFIISAPNRALSWYYVMPFLVMSAIGSSGWGLWRYRRDGGQWTTSVVLSYSFIALMLLNCLAHVAFRGISSAVPLEHWLDQTLPLLGIGFGVLRLYYYKRDISQRPWRFGPYAARYKQSPVAAEQEYRLDPLLFFMMGIAFACVSILAMGIQFFGVTLALLICSALIIGSLGLAFWLKK